MLLDYADEYTEGQKTVAAREAIQEGLGEHKDRADELARELERVERERDELRERLETPDVADWVRVTANSPGELKAAIGGGGVTMLGFIFLLASIWAERVLSASVPFLLVDLGLTLAFVGATATISGLLALLAWRLLVRPWIADEE